MKNLKKDKKKFFKQFFHHGVTKLICAGYSLESSKKALNIAQQYENIYAIVGISPNDIPNEIDETKSNAILNETTKTILIEKTENNLVMEDKEKSFENQLAEIEKLAQNKKIVAIGEIGLDYYWNKENRKWQQETFIRQIELANKLHLPIVIHTREAVFDTLDILKNKIAPVKKGIFHCCPLNKDLVREGLKLGFYISFAGPVTFKNAKNAEEIVNMVPLDKLLIETDSPYLAPEPLRGTRNDSRNVKYIAEKIAKIKGISLEEVAKASFENAEKIFEIRKTC